ncbi:hypothetical protein MNEG_8882, partial [Monoraphidium neglectum]
SWHKVRPRDVWVHETRRLATRERHALQAGPASEVFGDPDCGDGLVVLEYTNNYACTLGRQGTDIFQVPANPCMCRGGAAPAAPRQPDAAGPARRQQRGRGGRRGGRR